MTSSGKNDLNIRTNASPKCDRTRWSKRPLLASRKPAKSHCSNEGSIINLGVMIVAFECGNGAQFNIQV